MTQDEIDALPEVHGMALFQKDDDGSVIDARDDEWMIGWHEGVRVKRRFRSGPRFGAVDEVINGVLTRRMVVESPTQAPPKPTPPPLRTVIDDGIRKFS